MRRLLLFALALVLPAGVPVAIGYRSATSDPLVRRASVSPADWPAGAAPVTIALLSDVHIGNAAMDRDRFARIAAAVTALKPDLIVLAGDFREGARTTVVTAGVGTSILPLRWRAPPDLWLVRAGP